jgi:hypothetical protein
MDEILRYTLISAGLLAVVVAALGGWLTPVSGSWRDGDRLIRLRQVALWVAGRSERRGGYEVYRGWAFFGRVRLRRAAVGKGLLTAMGFDPRTVFLVEGRALAHFDFHLVDDELIGTFEGQRLSFSYTPPRIEAAVRLAKGERSWQRAAE